MNVIYACGLINWSHHAVHFSYFKPRASFVMVALGDEYAIQTQSLPTEAWLILYKRRFSMGQHKTGSPGFLGQSLATQSLLRAQHHL